MTTDGEGMRQTIRYAVTVDDMVAFNEFHYLHSPDAMRKRKRKRVILSVSGALVYLVLGYCMHVSAPGIFGWWFAPVLGLLIGLLIYGLGSPRFNIPHLLRYLVRRRYAKADTAKYLGEHFLEVDDQGFSHRTAYTETRFAWGALERIETAQDRTFLYISSFQAVVIPHKCVIEGNFAALLMAVKSHYKPGQVLEPVEKK
jgi:hypothetical protein